MLILTDDQGWGDLSVHGNTNLDTPHVDSLAHDGARFEAFFVQPVCSPTRAELLTGRYHTRSGIRGTSAGDERLDLSERTIAESFQAAGYATGCFGKWHNGWQYPYHPTARGFGEFYGFCSGHWGHYFDWTLEHNGELVQGNGYVVDDLTDRALAFIEAHRDAPFFVYLPYNTPHSPMQVPDAYYERFAAAEPAMRHRDPEQEDLAMTRAALAMCENIDANVGRLLQKLDELDLAGETIVVYFTDNGPNSWRWNAGMRGRKGSTDEGGVRVPCLIRWPSAIEPGTVIPQIAAAVDLLPTLTELSGIEIVGEKPLDGISVAPLLTGQSGPWEDRMIFTHWNDRVSVRTQRYRLDHQGRLYDLAADPGQRRDVAEEHPEVARALREAVAQWRQETMTDLGPDERPFPVGYREFPTTYLPARDGVAHGNVVRSNRFPNASFFTGWEDTEDRITWDVEVATAGDYEAVLYYTCREEDVGATIELDFRDAAVRGTVAEAHDPPFVGAAEDRVPRIESYVKDFRPLPLGVMRLEAGRDTLSLRALEIPGERVVDVRYIRLRLLEP